MKRLPASRRQVSHIQRMSSLAQHEAHYGLNARFTEVNGMEVVEHYGDPLAEHAALSESAGVLDLSFRSRLCLSGEDQQKFLNGQVTNNVKDLKVGEGCYAALVNAKGRIQSDLNIYRLENEILLDLEPGYSAAVAQRLEKYIIADDVQVVDVAPHYGLLSVQGPKAVEVLTALLLKANDQRHATTDPSEEGNRRTEDRTQRAAPGFTGFAHVPTQAMSFASVKDGGLGEIYLMNLPRIGTSGFDVFVPAAALGAVMDRLISAANAAGGRVCGWLSLETARIEAGIPRYGVDMDETNLAPETGIEARAISYSKGCYIGQEVIARIRTYGQVAKALRGLQLAGDLKTLPVRGDKLFKDGNEVGYVTSAIASPTFKANLALGYVRREHNPIGTELRVRTGSGDVAARIVPLPFTHA